MIQTFSRQNLRPLFDEVCGRDKDLKAILNQYGYPPVWIRPNSFQTLVLIILEQQVSLASAYSAFQKLKDCIEITPRNLLQLTDEELRTCYLSRQKIIYTKELATAIVNKRISLKRFETQTEEVVRSELKVLKGIGDWTVDIYLLHALRRADVFPTGDLALVNSIKMVKQVSTITKEDLLTLSNQWKPYRSIATMLFWHYYINKRNIKLLH